MLSLCHFGIDVGFVSWDNCEQAGTKNWQFQMFGRKRDSEKMLHFVWNNVIKSVKFVFSKSWRV